MHISSSYAKILGEKLFRTWEIPRSGSKAKDGEKKKEREKERKSESWGKQWPSYAWRTQGACKPPGPTIWRLKRNTHIIFLHVLTVGVL